MRKIVVSMQEESGLHDHEYEAEFANFDWRERGLMITLKGADNKVIAHAWYPYNQHWQVWFK